MSLSARPENYRTVHFCSKGSMITNLWTWLLADSRLGRFPAAILPQKRLFTLSFNGPVGSVVTLEGLDGYGFWIWR